MTNREIIVITGINLTAEICIAPYYLKSYLQTDDEVWNAVDVKIRFFHENKSAAEIAREILSMSPRVIAYSTYCWSVKCLLEVSAYIGARTPEIVQVMGGPEVEGKGIQLLKQNPSLHFIVLGEGEQTFEELIRSIFVVERNPADIPGLVYREHFQIKETAPRSLIPNLDLIPSPFLTGVVSPEDLASGLGAYHTARGCVFDCSFCRWGPRKVRFFSEERVEAELAMIFAAKPDWIWWCDAVFNLNPKRTDRILKLLDKYLRGGVRTMICIELDAELLTDEQIAFFGKHCTNFKLNIGLQSINPQALVIAHRRLRPKLFKERVNRLLTKAPSVFCKLDLIYGLPGDNYSGTLKSLDFALQLGVSQIEYQNLMILPGSRFYREIDQWGIKVNSSLPHLVTQNFSYSENEMVEASLLQIGISFYNIGMFDGCFELISEETGLSPANLLENFSRWLSKQMRLRHDLNFYQEQPLPKFLDHRIRMPKIMFQREELLRQFYANFIDKSYLLDAVINRLRANLLKSIIHYSDTKVTSLMKNVE